MITKLATYNVENLFTRPAAMAEDAGAKGSDAVKHHAELNAIVAKPVYDAADVARLLELEKIYRFAATNPPRNALVLLQEIRGNLYSRTRAGKVGVAAKGRDDWTGWFELARDDVGWKATYNTARVIHETDADLLICVEVENRPTLERFNQQVLGAVFGRAYPHVMVIDGNDPRGIDVGILSRWPIEGIRSHVDDRNADGSLVFSRDSPEYLVRLPDGRPLLVIPNHFKSKHGGNDRRSKARRLAQAGAAAAIGTQAAATAELVLLGGDLNDTPDSAELAPLAASGLTEAQDHASYPTDRPGTFGTGTASNKIDYLWMSAPLRARLTEVGIERRGSYHPRSWKPFDSVTGPENEASDHHLLWALFDL